LIAQACLQLACGRMFMHSRLPKSEDSHASMLLADLHLVFGRTVEASYHSVLPRESVLKVNMSCSNVLAMPRLLTMV
jgi:hypothetical protein